MSDKSICVKVWLVWNSSSNNKKDDAKIAMVRQRRRTHGQHDERIG